MKTRDVLAMHAAIERAMADPTKRPTKYAYALARNLRILTPLVEAYRDALKGEWIAPLEVFERERQALVMKHAQRDGDGNPVVRNVGMAVIVEPEVFATELQELQERHPDVQGAQIKFDERQAELVDIENEVALFMLAFDDLPNEIDVATMSALLPMIAEPSATAA